MREVLWFDNRLTAETRAEESHSPVNDFYCRVIAVLCKQSCTVKFTGSELTGGFSSHIFAESEHPVSL